MAEIPRNPGEYERAERDKAIARIQDFLKIDPKDVKSTITDEHCKTLENNNKCNFDIDDVNNRLLAVQMLGLSKAVSALIPYDGRRIVTAWQVIQVDGRWAEADFYCGKAECDYGSWNMGFTYDARLRDSKGRAKEAYCSTVLPENADLVEVLLYGSMYGHVTQAIRACEPDLRTGLDEWHEKNLEILPNGGRARREYNGDRLHDLELEEKDRNACYRVDWVEHTPFFRIAGEPRDIGIEGYVTITQEMLMRFLHALAI